MRKERWAKIFGAGFLSFLFGALIGEVCPDPTDIIHFFYILPWLNANTNASWLYWLVAVFDWYFLTALWYAFLLALTFFWKAERVRKVSTITSLLAFGIIIGTISRIIAGV